RRSPAEPSPEAKALIRPWSAGLGRSRMRRTVLDGITYGGGRWLARLAEDPEVPQDGQGERLVAPHHQRAVADVVVGRDPPRGHQGEGVPPPADGGVGGAARRRHFPGGQAVVPVPAARSLQGDADRLAVIGEARQPKGPGQRPDGQVVQGENGPVLDPWFEPRPGP